MALILLPLIPLCLFCVLLVKSHVKQDWLELTPFHNMATEYITCSCSISLGFTGRFKFCSAQKQAKLTCPVNWPFPSLVSKLLLEQVFFHKIWVVDDSVRNRDIYFVHYLPYPSNEPSMFLHCFINQDHQLAHHLALKYTFYYICRVYTRIYSKKTVMAVSHES
jgi:inner membrane protein involved in colicin E2 resistance